MLKFVSDGVAYEGFTTLKQTHAFQPNERVMIIWQDGEVNEIFVYDASDPDVLDRILTLCGIGGPNDARLMLLSDTGLSVQYAM